MQHAFVKTEVAADQRRRRARAAITQQAFLTHRLFRQYLRQWAACRFGCIKNPMPAAVRHNCQIAFFQEKRFVVICHLQPTCAAYDDVKAGDLPISGHVNPPGCAQLRAKIQIPTQPERGKNVTQ